MAAANFSENKWVNSLINIVTSLIIVLVTVYFTTTDLDARELQQKIDSKADKEYVDDMFKSHIFHDQQAYAALEKLMKSYLEGQEKLIESIDNRLERIENKN